MIPYPVSAESGLFIDWLLIGASIFLAIIAEYNVGVVVLPIRAFPKTLVVSNVGFAVCVCGTDVMSCVSESLQ